MKRALMILLTMAMLASAALAEAQDAQTALRARAEELCDALLDGDYATLVAAFDETMAAQLSAEALAASWDMIAPMLGAREGRGTVSGEAQPPYDVVQIQERFANGDLAVRFVFDAQARVAGLQMIPVAAPVEAEEETGPWSEIECTVAGDPDWPLGATLCLPEGGDGGLPPAVVLVQGSGSSDRDETIFQNRPFRDLAHALAELGVATLRYDKRTYIYPEAAGESGMDIDLRGEMLDDVNACIELLRVDGRVDAERIFVLGHSLGGMMVPAIAAENSDLAGAVSMAGSLRPLWEILYDQNLEAVEAARAGELSAEMAAQLEEQLRQIEADVAVLRGDFSQLPDDRMLMGVPAGYWKSQKEYCGMNFIDAIDLPLLILQGEADFQVYADVDYPLWQEALEGRDNATFCLYPELNHLMMPTQGLRSVADYMQPAHVRDAVIADIAAFVNEN